MSRALRRSWRLAQQWETHPQTRRSAAASSIPTALRVSSYGSEQTPLLSSSSTANLSQNNQQRQASFHRRTITPPTTRPTLKTHHLPHHNYSQQCQQRAPFSTSPRLDVAGAPGVRTRDPKMGQSLGVQQQKQREEALRKGDLPDDVGLLPGTFVMPEGEARPSWWRNFAGRRRLERRRLATRFQEIGATVNYRFISIKPRPRLELAKIRSTALELYKQMYGALASGNIDPIQHTLCTGLRTSLRKRVTSRGPHVAFKWQCHKVLSKPKIVSYRAVITPITADAKLPPPDQAFAVVQAVVRLHTLQSLIKTMRLVDIDDEGKSAVIWAVFDETGRRIAPESEEEVAVKSAKPKVEYVVIQQIINKSVPGSRKLWGMVQPTTLAKLDEEEAKEAANVAKGSVAS